MKLTQWCKSKLQWISHAIITSWWWEDLQSAADMSLFVGFLGAFLVLVIMIGTVFVVCAGIILGIILMFTFPIVMTIVLGSLGAPLWLAIIARRQYRKTP